MLLFNYDTEQTEDFIKLQPGVRKRKKLDSYIEFQ